MKHQYSKTLLPPPPSSFKSGNSKEHKNGYAIKSNGTLGHLFGGASGRPIENYINGNGATFNGTPKRQVHANRHSDQFMYMTPQNSNSIINNSDPFNNSAFRSIYNRPTTMLISSEHNSYMYNNSAQHPTVNQQVPSSIICNEDQIVINLPLNGSTACNGLNSGIYG